MWGSGVDTLAGFFRLFLFVDKYGDDVVLTKWPRLIGRIAIVSERISDLSCAHAILEGVKLLAAAVAHSFRYLYG
jgi:hypothetical protein